MKELLKKSRIDIDPYIEKIYFFTDRDEYLSVLKYFKVNEIDNLTKGHTLPMYDDEGDSWTLVFVDGFDLSNLAHELSHVALHWFDVKGIPVNADYSEAFAYLMGYLTKKCLEMKDK